MKTILFPTLLISALAFFDLGCSEADRTFDCTQICDKYEECFDDDLDNTECVDSCEDEADSDADFEERVDDCEKCLNDTSCGEATVGCTDECAFIIIEST